MILVDLRYNSLYALSVVLVDLRSNSLYALLVVLVDLRSYSLYALSGYWSTISFNWSTLCSIYWTFGYFHLHNMATLHKIGRKNALTIERKALHSTILNGSFYPTPKIYSLEFTMYQRLIIYKFYSQLSETLLKFLSLCFD